MIDDLAHTLELSSFAVVAMFLLCLICSFMVAQIQDGIPAQIMSYIGVFGAGFAGNVAFRKLELHPLGAKDLDAVLATTSGLIVGLLAFVLLKLTLTVIYGTARNIPKTDEDAIRSVSNG